jgi:hypothetical protein
MVETMSSAVANRVPKAHDQEPRELVSAIDAPHAVLGPAAAASRLLLFGTSDSPAWLNIEQADT